MVIATPIVSVPEDDDAEEKEEQKLEDEAMFVLSHDIRRRSTCLHRRDGCYRGQRLLFKKYELVVGAQPVDGSFTDICRSCWPDRLGVGGRCR